MITAAPRWDLDGRVDGKPCRLLVDQIQTRKAWDLVEPLKGFEGRGYMYGIGVVPPEPGAWVRLWFAHPLNDSLGVAFDAGIVGVTLEARGFYFEWKTYGPPVDVGNVVG